jgi:hypothetical protein
MGKSPERRHPEHEIPHSASSLEGAGPIGRRALHREMEEVANREGHRSLAD